MSAQEVFAQQFARLCHHYRDALWPAAANVTEPQLESWNALPRDERSRLVAAASLAILELETKSDVLEDSRRYFAKPGTAEWGC
jgi:hypothetical protein